MMWMFLWLGLAFATQLWLSFKVGRSSIPLAIATFFLGPPGAVYTLFKNRGDEETSVTVPFVANLLFTVLFFVSAWGAAQQALLTQEEAIQREVLGMQAGTQANAMPVQQAVPAAVSEPFAASTALAAAAAVAAGAASAPVDPMEALSSALRGAGIAHTLTRLPASAPLPAGAADAAEISVPSRLAAAAASAASAPADYAVTLFRCETAAACRGIAGAYMQKTGEAKRRVLQNGTLLLALPQIDVVNGDADLTPTAIASVFRRLELRP